MTRAEKLAQLGSFWAFEVVGEDGPRRRPAGRAAPATGIGQITRLAGSTNLRPIEVAETANAIQRYLVEETRLGHPGDHPRGVPPRPHRLGRAVLPAVDRRGGERSTRTSSRRWPRRSADGCSLTGARHALAPVLDIARDPRWGRIEETYGEDPYLAAELGCAYVAALQGPDLADGVLATGKHMVGHGLAEGGLNQAPAHIGPRELRDEQLVPVRGGRPPRRDRAASCRPTATWTACRATPRASCSTTILRDEWGFDGIVASDYIGRRDARDRPPADRATSARPPAWRSRAGVDAELPRTVGVRRAARRRASTTGASTRRSLDAAVGRVLRMKFRLGLFERPYVEVPTEAALDGARRRRGAGRAGARRAVARPARERRGAAARAGPPPRRGHRADRRQRPRPARRLQPPGPHGDAARDAHGRRRARRHRRRRGHRAGRRAVRAPDDPRRAARRAGRRRGRPRPRDRASRPGPTRSSRRRSRSRAAPTSRSSCSASGPA